MKSFLAIALATTALIAAAPAFAQDSESDALQDLRSLLGNPPSDPAERDLNEQEHHLADLLEESANQGRIDHRQADRAFNELRTIRVQQDDLRARHGGRLTPADHDYLRDHLAGLDREVDQMREAGGPERHDEDRDRGGFWEHAPADLDQREEWLDRRIHDGVADGSLDRDDAHRGLQEVREIRHTEREYQQRDGGDLSDEHRTELAQRLEDLGQQLHWNREHRD
jgi:hypothetical protein